MTEARLAMVIVLFVGSFAIIFGTYGVYRLIYKGVLSDKKVKKVHNNDQILIFDGKLCGLNIL